MFQIKFEAVIGNSFRSDIAVDDIAILRHPCDGLPTESLCDFEKGLNDCNYQESGEDFGFQWSWYDSSTFSTTAQKTLNSLSGEGTVGEKNVFLTFPPVTRNTIMIVRKKSHSVFERGI